MAHDHQHNHGQAEYYLEQIFTIGICGALGAVAVSLYVTGKLNLMLNPKFHPWVLGGGIGLLVMVAVRALAVWNSVADPRAIDVHDDHGHDHGHEDCGHAQGACGHAHHDDHGHSHSHGHDHDDHGHSHSHGHEHDDHGHSHSHGHDDHGHDHGWAPWRYVVLMLPVVLYLLNLPNEGFSAYKAPDRGDVKFAGAKEIGDLGEVSLLQLEKAAGSANQRDTFEGKRVTVIGRYSGDDPKRFSLSRFRINCCAADATPLNVFIMIDPDPKVKGVDSRALQGRWLRVTGVVSFMKDPRNGDYFTTIVVQPKEGEELPEYVDEVPMPANPFIT